MPGIWRMAFQILSKVFNVEHAKGPGAYAAACVRNGKANWQWRPRGAAARPQNGATYWRGAVFSRGSDHPRVGDGVGGADYQRADLGVAATGRATRNALVTRGVNSSGSSLDGVPADAAQDQRGRGHGPRRPYRRIGPGRFGQPGRRAGFRVLSRGQNPIM